MFSLFLPILLHFPASFYNLFKSKNPSLYSLVRHGFIQHGSGSISLFGAEPLICGAGVFMFFVFCKRKNWEKLAALQLALKWSAFPFGVIGLHSFRCIWSSTAPLEKWLIKRISCLSVALLQERQWVWTQTYQSCVEKGTILYVRARQKAISKCVSFGSKWGVIFLGDR